MGPPLHINIYNYPVYIHTIIAIDGHSLLSNTHVRDKIIGSYYMAKCIKPIKDVISKFPFVEYITRGGGTTVFPGHMSIPSVFSGV